MAARKDDPTAVERSLEDFIARANTTLPAPEPDVGAALGRRRSNQRPDKKEGTLVVVGSQKPLAEVTEIVTRLPVEELDGVPQRKRWTSLRFGLVAFFAGAVAVLIITRFVGGGPKPLPPVAPPPPPVAVAPVPPPIIVQPLPPSEAALAAPEAAPAPAPETAPAPAPEPAAAAAPPPKPHPVRRAAVKPAKPDKRSTGLVDPFAP
jgi:hypothetical protein